MSRADLESLKRFLLKLNKEYIEPLNTELEKLRPLYNLVNQSLSLSSQALEFAKETTNKVDKTKTPNQLYGTDENGNPALYPTDSVGTQVLVEGQKVKEFNADSKQDIVAFDGEYNVDTNKVATVQTVTNKIAEVVANAPEDLNTLEEIAAWIAEHPESVAEINARIARISSRVEDVEKELPKFIEKENVGIGLEYNDGLRLVTSIGALTARTGFPVTGDTMDDMWKEVATNNQAEWKAEDWEKFYAFIGAVKDYHTNRNGIARFHDGRLDVTDGLVNSSSPHAINGRVLYKNLETAKSEAVASANGYTDASKTQMTTLIANSLPYSGYVTYEADKEFPLQRCGYYMVFSDQNNLSLVKEDGTSVIDGAKQMIIMAVPYGGKNSKLLVANGVYFYDGTFSITNPKVPMGFINDALKEGCYIAKRNPQEGIYSVAAIIPQKYVE